jgi:2-keto-4-pentenoate hydratase
VEAEIAFVLKEDLMGPGVTVADVMKATDHVLASFEIVDSRIRDWKIGLIDTVSDNASSGLFLLGDQQVKLGNIDLKKIEMSLYKNGEFVNSGRGDAALGDPAYCVAWLANKMSEFGVALKKDEVILSGALSAAITAEAGDSFRADFTGLGTVEVKFI